MKNLRVELTTEINFFFHQFSSGFFDRQYSTFVFSDINFIFIDIFLWRKGTETKGPFLGFQNILILF